MNIQKKKCSLKEHSEINADIYCKKCEIYMCKECEIYHSKLFEDHQSFILNANIKEINYQFCEEEAHHNNKLNYFCKTHNKLCCSACITKIKRKEDGKHSDCDVCCIEDIKEEKKNKLLENINFLEELSNKFNKSFNDINKICERINKTREKLKYEIQLIFIKLRNTLNNREDELLLNVDKEYDNLFFKGDIIKDIEKLPDKIELSLEKCKNIYKIDNNIYKFIKEIIEIENNINIISDFNSNINNIYNSKNIKIKLNIEESEMNKFVEKIKTFGNIELINNNYEIFKLSSIISDDINSHILINNWIEEVINKKEIKYELIFRMSENGTDSSDFHKYCDNKGSTLTLVKTSEDKIFGGFTPLNWNENGGYYNDLSNQTFIFSLNLKKKYNMINKDRCAIYCSKECGPSFGSADFRLNENMKIGASYANKNSNFLSHNNLELTGGKGNDENFETDEFEVYLVIN